MNEPEFVDDIEKFRECELLFHEFSKKARELGISSDVYTKTLLTKLIYICVYSNYTNTDYLEMMEEAWYKVAPKIREKLDALS